MSHIEGKGHCQTCQIRHLSIFSNLSEQQLKDITDFHPTVMSFSAGEEIYSQGATSKSAYTLRKGIVKLCKSLPDGRTQILRVLLKGDIFGFEGFVGDAPYNLSAIAVTASEVCRLPLDSLKALRSHNDVIDTAMMNRWLEQLRCAEDMMLELGAKKAAERLASFLINWSDKNASNDEWVELPLTRGELGELLGLTIETISRLFSQWKKSGLIEESKGRLRIIDKQQLLEHVTP